MENKHTFRKAEEKDFYALCVLIRMLANHHYALDSYWKPGRAMTTNQILELVIGTVQNKNAQFIVAEKDERIIGFFIAKIKQGNPYTDEKYIGYITNAFVLPPYRNKGVTHCALKMLRTWFTEHGVRYIELIVSSFNTDTLKVWQKAGFFEYTKTMRMPIS